MTQGVLPFKVEVEASPSGATALGGLPAYLELAHVMNLASSVADNLRARGNEQGWSDTQIVMSLVLLQLAGGECVDDLRVLESDDGFRRIMLQVEAALLRLPRPERRRLLLQWRKERKRAVPSPSTVFRFLDAFEVDESDRQTGKAWIPIASDSLKGLYQVNAELIARVVAFASPREATLDVDATLIECFKQGALFCYKHFRSYQPLQVYWAEQDLLLHSEFRDGNVPAGYDITRVLTTALDFLPQSVERVRVRSDSAAYQWDFLLYLASGRHPRFGAIDFTVSIDVTPEFRAAVAEVNKDDWKPVQRSEFDSAGNLIKMRATDKKYEYAEVVFEPQGLSRKKDNPQLRFIAVRQPMDRQLKLPATDASEPELPFPTIILGEQQYKLHGIVANDWTRTGSELLLWHWERCGKSEEVHAVLKNDLAGGRLPCSHIGGNAAWWALTVIAYNLNTAMKRLVLGTLDPSWITKRLKAVRFAFIGLAGRVIEHARACVLRLARTASAHLFLRAREVIASFAGQT